MRKTMYRRFVAGTIASTLAFGAGFVGAGTANAAPTGCNGLITIVVPGTWETEKDANKSGLLGVVTGAMSKLGPITVKNVDYPASVGGLAAPFTGRSTPISDSIKTGVDNTLKYAAEYKARCPRSKFAMLGYSQGSIVAGDAVEKIGNNKAKGISADDFIGAVLFADPRRPKSVIDGKKVRRVGSEQTIGPKDGLLTGQGIFGWRKDMGKMTGKTITICGLDDLFCNMPVEAAKTGDLIASLAEYNTGSNADQIVALGTSGFGKLSRETAGISPSAPGTMDPNTVFSQAAQNPASIMSAVGNIGKLVPTFLGNNPIGAIGQMITGQEDPNDPQSAIRRGISPQGIASFAGMAKRMGDTGGHTVYPTMEVSPGVTSTQWAANWLMARR